MDVEKPNLNDKQATISCEKSSCSTSDTEPHFKKYPEGEITKSSDSDCEVDQAATPAGHKNCGSEPTTVIPENLESSSQHSKDLSPEDTAALSVPSAEDQTCPSDSSLQDPLVTSKMVQGSGRGLFLMPNCAAQTVARYFAMPAVNRKQTPVASGNKARDLEYIHIAEKKENGYQRENNCENTKTASDHGESDDEYDDEDFDDENEDWSFDEEEDIKPGKQCPCAFKHPANENGNKHPLQRQSSNVDKPGTSGLHNNPFFTATNILECPDCDQSFDCRVDLNRHRLQHVSEKSFKCGHCDKSFAFSFNLKSHERQHTGEKPYICSECGLSFVHAFNLHEHQLVHKGSSHFVCSICLKSFSVETKYLLHIRRHSSIKPFKCNMCGKAFHRAAGLRAHELLHSAEKEDHPFSCRFCDRLFTRMSHKQMHERVHISGKLFPCLQCGNTFTEASQLKMHVCTQRRGQHFLCDICKESFSSLELLDSHAKTHVAKMIAMRRNRVQSSKVGIFNKGPMLATGMKKRFPCKLCSQRFSNKRLLGEHEKIHQREYTPYMCKECCLTFTHSNYLKLHLLTHQVQKSFQCKLCPQKLASQAELEVHEEGHIDGTRPNLNVRADSQISAESTSHENIFIRSANPSSLATLPPMKIKSEPE